VRIEHFRYLFNRELDVFYLTEDVRIFKKPFNIWNEKTGESVDFKTLDEVLDHKIDGVTVREIIEKMEKPYIPELEGGRGASSGSNGTFKFSGSRGSGKSDAIPPAVANTKIKSKSLEGALAEFKRNHLLANREFSYSVDEDGYVTGYNRGQKSSVAVPSHGKQGKGRKNMIIHNHPSGGAFSDADLKVMASDKNAKGIIASGKKYDYKVEKGTHFKAQSFTKAVSNAKMKGKDYDDAVDKWLKKNQKKYGYTYSRTKN
jgi:hypothetical protein